MPKSGLRWFGGLVMGLLLATGTAAHAQEMPTDPSQGPEHLAALLPDVVGGEPLAVIGLPPGSMSRQAWMNTWGNLSMDLLPALGKSADDMRFAFASTLGDPPLVVLAVQVADVSNDDVAAAVIEGINEAAVAAGAAFSPADSVRTEDIDGDHVHVLETPDQDGAMLLYPVAEALFVILVPGFEGVATGPTAEMLTALRDAVERWQRPSVNPATQRFELADVGIAVTLPGDWKPALEGIELDDDGHIFMSPDGLFRYCTFGARHYEGRVTADFIWDVVTPRLVDPTIWSRVQTAAGGSVRSLDEETDLGILPELTVTGATYYIPSGDSMILAGCVAGQEGGPDSDGDWRQVVDAIEFLDTGPTVADATRVTRDLVCSILVPRPLATDEIRMTLRAMPRPGLGDVTREVRRFLRRHGKQVLGSLSPGTMRRSGDLTYMLSWSNAPFVRSGVERSLKELGDGDERTASKAAIRLFEWFAGSYGAFDDEAMRRDAQRVSELVYHYGVRGIRGDAEQHWNWMNSGIDVSARAQDLGSCLRLEEEAVLPATVDELATTAASPPDGPASPTVSSSSRRRGEGMTIGYITPEFEWPPSEIVLAGTISAADAAGVQLLICEAEFDGIDDCARELEGAGVDGVIRFDDGDLEPELTCRALQGTPMIMVDAAPELGVQDCWTALVGADNAEVGRLAGDAIGRYASEQWDCEFDAYVSLQGPGPISAAITDGTREGFVTWCDIPRKDEHVIQYGSYDGNVFADKVRRMARRVKGDRLVIVGYAGALGIAQQALSEAGRADDAFYSGVGGSSETAHAIACEPQFIASAEHFSEARYAELAMTAMIDHLRGDEITFEMLTAPRIVDESNVRDIYPDTASC